MAHRGADGAKVRETPRKFAKLEKAKQDRLLSPTAPAVMKANQQVAPVKDNPDPHLIRNQGEHLLLS